MGILKLRLVIIDLDSSKELSYPKEVSLRAQNQAKKDEARSLSHEAQ